MDREGQAACPRQTTRIPRPPLDLTHLDLTIYQWDYELDRHVPHVDQDRCGSVLWELDEKIEIFEEDHAQQRNK